MALLGLDIIKFCIISDIFAIVLIKFKILNFIIVNSYKKEKEAANATSLGVWVRPEEYRPPPAILPELLPRERW